MKIIDNFLNDGLASNLEKTMLSPKFPWFFCDNIVSSQDDDRHQFTHFFYKEGEPHSQFYNYLIDIGFLANLSIASLIKIKGNFQTKTSTIQKNHLHTDHSFPNALTAIYYVNENDGYTYFEDGKIVKSKFNRLIIFPSDIKHGGTTCTNKKYRCVLNINYYPMESKLLTEFGDGKN
jgi:hypothetical protein